MTAWGDAETASVDCILPPPFGAEENRKERRKLNMQDNRQVENDQAFPPCKDCFTTTKHPQQSTLTHLKQQQRLCNCGEERVVEEQQGAVNNEC